MASELREELQDMLQASSHAFANGDQAKGQEHIGEALRALAAQAARMSRNDAFNLADTVAEHYACGRPEEARQAIMAMAAQPATVPEGMSLLVDALEGAMIESLHGEGFDLWAKNRGKLRNRLPESVGAIIVKMRAMLAAAPSPNHSAGAGKMVTEGKACPMCKGEGEGYLPNGDGPYLCNACAPQPEAQAGADVTDAMIDAGYAAMHRISFAASPRDRLTAMWVAMNAAMPKPAEGGAVGRGFANDLNVFLNRYRAHLPQEAMAESYSLANRANAITWETATAGSGEALALIVEALETSAPLASIYPEPRARHEAAIRAARRLANGERE